MSKKYVFKPYNPFFVTLFEVEKERLQGLLRSAVIEHVGSTAVEGLGGKGIIDIAIGVLPGDIENSTNVLIQLGYAYRESGSTDERLFFRIDLPDRIEEMRRYHVHLTLIGSSDWKRFLAFRDHLRKDPKAAEEYATLKKEGVSIADGDGHVYRGKKKPFFDALFLVEEQPILDECSEKFDLKNGAVDQIDHADTMIARVYTVETRTSKEAILKILTRKKDFIRELFFLRKLVGVIPVPEIYGEIQLQKNDGYAILMQKLKGEILKKEDMTPALAYQLGSILGKVHEFRGDVYGDVSDEASITENLAIYFGKKIREELAECSLHFNSEYIDKCRHFYERWSGLLERVDGPCIVHRDFRPGNILISDGKIEGVIDWSSARFGFAEQDFLIVDSNLLSGYVDEFCKGYASIRKVPFFEKMIPLLRFARAIAIIGYTVKSSTWDTKNKILYMKTKAMLDEMLEAQG